MAFNDFDELKTTTLRSFASGVATGLQTATNSYLCGGANQAVLAIRTQLGNATAIWIRPQQSVDGSTWFDITTQAVTGASVLATPLQYKLTVSGYSAVELRSVWGNRIRVKTQVKTLATGAKVGVDLWLDRK
jgi:hypothetical protein